MIPITFQTLMLNAVSLGDTLMLGLVSQESLAAVSLASQVSFVMSLFISTLTGGATVLSAQYIGKRIWIRWKAYWRSFFGMRFWYP